MAQAALPSTDFRRLWPADRPAFLAHLLRLDSQSRNDRFGGAVSESFLRRYAENAFHHDDVLCGCFIDGALCGAGELRAIRSGFGEEGGGTAEAAFSVETPFRRRGIGSALLTRLMRAATNRGVARVQVYCLAHNIAMQALARKVEAELRLEHDTLAGDLITLAPTPMTLWREAADTAFGGVTAMLDWQARFYAPSEPKAAGG
jgi:RimJ/RimL family protein N-acetyltransferase